MDRNRNCGALAVGAHAPRRGWEVQHDLDRGHDYESIQHMDGRAFAGVLKSIARLTRSTGDPNLLLYMIGSRVGGTVDVGTKELVGGTCPPNQGQVQA